MNVVNRWNNAQWLTCLLQQSGARKIYACAKIDAISAYHCYVLLSDILSFICNESEPPTVQQFTAKTDIWSGSSVSPMWCAESRCTVTSSPSGAEHNAHPPHCVCVCVGGGPWWEVERPSMASSALIELQQWATVQLQHSYSTTGISNFQMYST